MDKTEIVVLDSGTLVNKDWNFDFPHFIASYETSEPIDVATRIKDANVVITNKVKIDAESIKNSPNLKLIAVAATGYEHIDLNAAAEHGVTVCNITNYGNDTVAEHAFMLILALMRQLPSYIQDVAAGKWQVSPYFSYFGKTIHDLHGKTLGIVGKGGIGKALAKRASVFGMTILWAEHKNATACREGYTPFEEVIEKADVISLHCPLTEQTRNSIAEQELQKMKPSAIVINVGRGGLIDEVALLNALQTNEIAGAGVDVLTTEPPINGNPLLNTSLTNLIITPHMAWGSEEAMHRLFDILVNNINSFIKGTPTNVV